MAQSQRPLAQSARCLARATQLRCPRAFRLKGCPLTQSESQRFPRARPSLTAALMSGSGRSSATA
eukprot:8326062-Pyramimonas_sp.AAC.1